MACWVYPVGTAEAQNGDTAYGRWTGDLVLSAAAGASATWDQRGDTGWPGLSVELRARLLDSAGLVLAADVRPGGPSTGVAALELRPLFVMRFLLNQESGDRVLDLFVDSIGVELGVAFGPWEAQADSQRGWAVAVGVGAELPIAFFGNDTSGLFVRMAGRYVGSESGESSGPDPRMSLWTASLALGIRAHADLGLARWEPARYEVERRAEATHPPAAPGTQATRAHTM